MPPKHTEVHRYSRNTVPQRGAGYRAANRTAPPSDEYRNTYQNRTSYTDNREINRGYGRNINVSSARAYTDYRSTYTEVPKEYQAPARPVQPENRPVHTRRVLTREQREENRQKVRARMKMMGVIAFVFLLGAILIYRHTAIFGKNIEIDALNNELNGIIVTNEGIQSNIDRSIELGNLESIAKNQLGMINPDSSQIFYVDMGTMDEVVKSSSH